MLLVEKKLQNNFDLVILLKCQKYLQIKRVLKRENMNREKFENINKKFIPERKKIKLSDYIINSGNGKNHTMSKIKELIKISQESGRKYMNVASAFFGETTNCNKKN